MYVHAFRPITTRNVEGTYLSAPVVVASEGDAAAEATLPGNQLYNSQSVDLLLVNTGGTMAFVTYASDEEVLPAASETTGLPLPPNAMFVVNVPGIITRISVAGGTVSVMRGLGIGS